MVGGLRLCSVILLRSSGVASVCNGRQKWEHGEPEPIICLTFHSACADHLLGILNSIPNNYNDNKNHHIISHSLRAYSVPVSYNSALCGTTHVILCNRCSYCQKDGSLQISQSFHLLVIE